MPLRTQPGKVPANNVQYALFGLRTGNIEQEFDWKHRVPIGQGAYGTVYKAQRVSDSQWFAVKSLSLEVISAKSLWKQVVHEIEIHRRLNNHRIVQFIDAFRTDTALYIIIELVDGGELHKLIRRRDQPFTERDAAFYLQQLLEALEYLHEKKNIVHRDLKPQNILVDTKRRCIKLIDFGFSKLVCRIHDTSWPLTMNPAMPSPNTLGRYLDTGGQPISTPIYNSPKGTIACLAPEILENIQHRNTRPRITTREEVKKLDMFAVGVVLFFMISGSYPFEPGKANMDYAAHAAHILQEIKSGFRFPSQVSAGASDLCCKLLVPDVTQRLSVVEALQHPWILEHEQLPETPLPPTTDTTQPDNNLYGFLRKSDTRRDAEDPAKLAAVEHKRNRTNPDTVAVRGPVTQVAAKRPSFNLMNMALPPPGAGNTRMHLTPPTPEVQPTTGIIHPSPVKVTTTHTSTSTAHPHPQVTTTAPEDEEEHKHGGVRGLGRKLAGVLHVGHSKTSRH